MIAIIQKYRPQFVLGSIIVSVCSLAYIIYTLTNRTGPSSAGATLQMIIGETAGEEAVKLLGGRGQLLVVVLDTSKGELPTVTQQFNGFMNTLKKHPQVQVVSVEGVEPDSERVLRDGEFGIPADQFRNLLEKYGSVDAIISFVGGPKLGEPPWPALPQRMPKMLAVSCFGVRGKGMRTLMDKGVIQVAISPNPSPPPILDTKPKPPSEWFRLMFKVITPETASLLPD